MSPGLSSGLQNAYYERQTCQAIRVQSGDMITKLNSKMMGVKDKVRGASHDMRKQRIERLERVRSQVGFK